MTFLILDCMWVRDLTGPMHLGLIKWALYAPYENHRSPVALPKLQMAPKCKLLISSGSRKQESKCMCLSEAKASLIASRSKKEPRYTLLVSQKSQQMNPLQVPQQAP